MAVVVFAGGGMPLQKVLEAAVKFNHIVIATVFTDLRGHSGVARFCKTQGIATADIALLGKASSEPPLPAHDWFFSVNSTIVFSRRILAAPRVGALNMHPGRLPDYAGLHTHQWAIRNGETEFAATLHWMTEAVDAGPIAYLKVLPVKPKETGISLLLKCLSAGAALATRALEDIAEHRPLPQIPQDLSRRHLYRGADAKAGAIDWRQSAVAIERFVRAADYGPLACPTYSPTTYLAGEALIILKAEATEEELAGGPGSIARVVPGAITVRAGDGRGLVIVKCRDSRGAIVNKEGDGGLKILAGNRFS